MHFHMEVQHPQGPCNLYSEYGDRQRVICAHYQFVPGLTDECNIELKKKSGSKNSIQNIRNIRCFTSFQ